MSSVNLVINGRSSVLVRTGEEIIDLLRDGQGVLNILPLAGVKDEVDAAIVELPGERAERSSAEPVPKGGRPGRRGAAGGPSR